MSKDAAGTYGGFPQLVCQTMKLKATSTSPRFFFYKQKTAYEFGLGIPAEPLFRSKFHAAASCHTKQGRQQYRYKSKRSEERRVGKECRCRRAMRQENKISLPNYAATFNRYLLKLQWVNSKRARMFLLFHCSVCTHY